MKKGVYLVIILLFPSIIYMLFSLGEHNVKRVGYFGQYSVEDGDTVYLPAPALSLQSSSGAVVNTSELSGKVLIVNLFHWPCDEECYKQGETLANYLNDLGNNEKWSLFSICMDTSASLSELDIHAKKYLVDMDNWTFLKPADQETFENWLEYSFVKTGRVASINDLPSADFVMIDQKGVIRAYFDSRIYKENKKMQDALKMLLKEPHLSWKDDKQHRGGK